MGEVEFDEVMLANVDLPLCRGCHVCFMRGESKCPHSPTVQGIAARIEKADCVIVTSPIYVLSLSGTLKNWLDHMAYNWHRPRYFTKKALVITTTAGAGAAGTAKYVRDNLKHWGFNRVYTLPVTCRSLEYQPGEKMKARTGRVASAFVNDVASGRLRQPTPKRLMFFNVWRAMAAAAAPDTADSTYWRNSGMGEMAFSPEVRTGPVKWAIGAVIYAVARKTMK